MKTMITLAWTLLASGFSMAQPVGFDKDRAGSLFAAFAAAARP